MKTKKENKSITKVNVRNVLNVDQLNEITGGMNGKVKWFNYELGVWVESEVEQ